MAGILQGTLLVMCLFWKARQHQLGIDDFGNPLVSEEEYTDEPPVPITQGPEDGASLEGAVHAAVETDVRSEHTADAANDRRVRAGRRSGRPNHYGD